MERHTVGELRKLLDDYTADWELEIRPAADPTVGFVFAGVSETEGDKTLVVYVEGAGD